MSNCPAFARRNGRLTLAGSATLLLLGSPTLLLFCSAALPHTALAAPRLQAGSVQAQPGWVIDVPVTLATNGAAVAAIGQHLFFDPRNTPVAARAPGTPDCWVEPNTGKQGYFAFWPDGCWQWPESCDMVVALVLSLESTQPIPDGPVFTCRVKVSPRAAPGDYAIESDYADASTPDGTEHTLDHFGGTIRVVAPPGSGTSGCTIGGRGPSLPWLLAPLLWGAWRRHGRARWGRKPRGALPAVVLPLLAIIPSTAAAQTPAAPQAPVQVLAIGGSLQREGSAETGTFRGEVAVFGHGGVSGAVEVEIAGRKETINLSARLGGGRLRDGRARTPRGQLRAVFAGELPPFARAGQLQPTGSVRWRDGSRYFWQLATIRLLGKEAPRDVIEALQRGERPAVFVHLDTYPIEREIRLRFRNKTGPDWIRPRDLDAAIALEQQLLQAQRAALVNELERLGIVVQSTALESGMQREIPLVLQSFQELGAVLGLPPVYTIEKQRGFRIEPLLRQSLPLIRQPEVVDRLSGACSRADRSARDH